MKIAIIGTRGIPNHYGGFEQFTEYLSQGLVRNGYDVYVYNSHNHPYKDKVWNEVNILHQYDPEYRVGTAGQFIYDLNCILDCRKQNFDIILQLGYTSSAIWGKLLPKESTIFTNMDGLEWKRTKYRKSVRKLIHYFEKLAVKYSDVLISDSIGIKNYIQNTYDITSTYIPYGATVFEDPSVAILKKYNLTPYEYDILIARLEPENSIEIILDGIVSSNRKSTVIIIGNYQTKYGLFLTNKYKMHDNLRFLGPIYDITCLNNLRYYSNLYFHGHTVGGTNPSLLEAMASSALICAHENIFNYSILGQDAFFFKSPEDIKNVFDKRHDKKSMSPMIDANIKKIQALYSWENIISQYIELFAAGTKVENDK